MLTGSCVHCVGSAINADSGEANKVCNIVTGEVGAVPAVARFYKVMAPAVIIIIPCQLYSCRRGIVHVVVLVCVSVCLSVHALKGKWL